MSETADSTIIPTADSTILQVISTCFQKEDSGFFSDILCAIKSLIQTLNESLQITLSILLGLILLGYFIQTVRYIIKYSYYKIKHNKKLFIGPFRVKGVLAESLGERELELGLRTEFQRIKNSLIDMGSTNPRSFHAATTGVQADYCLAGLRVCAPIPKVSYSDLRTQTIERDISIKIGTVNIPIGEILNSISSFLGLLPMPFRKRYRKSLICSSFVSHDEHIRLTVYCPRGYKEKGIWRTKAYAKTYKVDDISDMDRIIRDAAFMILDIDDKLEYTDWRSMRFLLDGFEAFEDYRKSGSSNYRDKAKEAFKLSIDVNPQDNLIATYYYAVMTMVSREENDIKSSICFFKKALKTKDERLQAFVRLGLAFCS